MFKEYNVTINLEKDLLIYTSHGLTKRSFHIVITNHCHGNNIEAKKFFTLVFDKLPENIKNTRYVDSSVYSVKQQFRILHSSKFGKNRPKKLMETFTLNGKEYKHKLLIDLERSTKKEQLKFLYNLEESLVSVINNCLLLPTFGAEDTQRKEIKYTGPEISLNDQSVNFALNLLSTAMGIREIKSIFGINKVESSLIMLKIKNRYNCLICKRTHESENPYMRINLYGQLYYYCRRSGESGLFLGNLNIENEMKDEKVNLLNQLISNTERKKEIVNYTFYKPVNIVEFDPIEEIKIPQ